MTIERNDLSLDAVKINGNYIETKVTGYRTIKAVGREMVERELETSNSRKDGSVLDNVRYQSREIDVTFFVQRDTLAHMRESMEALKSILDVKEAQIVFNGDCDFYFTGTPVLDNSLTETWNGLIGTFTIHCMDPCKYSITEYSVAAVANQWSFTYDGTYKSYPKFEIDFPETLNGSGDNTDTSECGFVGLANQTGAMLQFGDPEEKDWADVTYPATVPVNRTFKSTSGWSANSTQVLVGTQAGSVSANSSGYIYPSSFGSGSGERGPALSYLITGETPPISKNFNFTWKQKLSGTKKQFGRCTVILWNNNSGTRTMVGAVRFVKSAKNTKCTIYLYCGSTTSVKSFTVECSAIGSCSMKKVDNKITFSVAKKTFTFANDTITDLVANEIAFHFAKKGSQTNLGTNYIYNCKLQRFSFDNYEDIENVFTPGDKLVIDTKNAEVTLDNGDSETNAQGLGALGNDWETFVLTPGTNLIEVEYSDWTTTPPSAVLKYRKVYL